MEHGGRTVLVPRIASVVALVCALFALGLPSAAVAAPSWPVPAPVALPNPVLPTVCDSLNVTLLLDASGSIKNVPDGTALMKQAAWSLVDGLKGSSATVSVVHFATGVKTYTTEQPVDSATTGPGGSIYNAIEAYRPDRGTSAGPVSPKYRLVGSDPLDPSQYTAASPNDASNWQGALQAAQAPGNNLVVLLTDGDPTAVISDGQSNTGMTPEPLPGAYLMGSTNPEMQRYAYFKSILAANTLKAAGSRMLAVGVGSATDFPSGTRRMQGVVGPTGAESEALVWDGTEPLEINEVGVLRLADWDALSDAMADIASSTNACLVEAGGLRVAKEFDAAGSGFDGAFDIVVDCDGTAFDRTLSLAAGQESVVSGVPAGTVCSVSEPVLPAAPAGWAFGAPVLDPVDGVVTVAADEVAAVTVTNSIRRLGVPKPPPVEPEVPVTPEVPAVPEVPVTPEVPADPDPAPQAAGLPQSGAHGLGWPAAGVSLIAIGAALAWSARRRGA